MRRIVLLACLALAGLALAGLARPVLAQGLADPVAYCRAVGTIDRPDKRYSGPTSPGWIATALKLPTDLPFAWRCAKGAVMACAYGANIPCDAKANVDRAPSAPIREFCRQNRGAKTVPAVVTGHDAAVSWRCRGTRPVVKGVAEVDAQGYQAAYWTKVSP